MSLVAFTAQTVTVEAAQTSLPAPTLAGDGADITAWATLLYSQRVRYADVAITAAAAVTLTNVALWEYLDSKWLFVGYLNGGAAIVIADAAQGFKSDLVQNIRGTRLALSATLSGAVAVTVAATPVESMPDSARDFTSADLHVPGTLYAGALVGPLTGDTTGTHYGPVGTEAGRSSPAVPANDTVFQAATSLSAAWWDFSALAGAGSIVSKGSVAGTLATSGTLAYGYTLGSQVGVHFDSSTGDAIRAVATLLPGLNSIMFGGRVGFATDPAGGQHTLMGNFRQTGGQIEGVVIRVDDNGSLIVNIGDAGVAHTFLLTCAPAGFMTVGAAPIDFIVQLDRSGADPVLRARWCRGGYLLGTAALTCAALGTLTGTSQELGFGALQLAAPAFNGGGWVQWGFWATGVQCEGASAAQLVSQGLGFEE